MFISISKVPTFRSMENYTKIINVANMLRKRRLWSDNAYDVLNFFTITVP